MIRTQSLLSRATQHTRLLGTAVGMVWKSAPGWTAANLSLIVVQGILPLATLYLTKLVVDAVAAGLAAPDKAQAFAQTAWLIAALGGVTLAGLLCAGLANLVGETQGQTITDHMQGIIHEKSVALDLGYYENSAYHDSLHRAQQEAPYRPTHIVNGLAQVAQSTVSVTALGGLLTTLHWAVPVVLVAAVLPGVAVRLRYAGHLYRWQRVRTPAERMASYMHSLLTGDAAAKEVRLLGLGRLFMGIFRDIRRTLRRERLEMAFHRTTADLLTQVAAAIAIFGAYAFIANRTIQGAITIGALVMYYQAFQRGQNSLRDMLNGMAGLYEDSLFLKNLHEFLNLPPRISAPARPQAVAPPATEGIVFDHVSFDYPDGARRALADLSLTIHPGEHIALVGPNGSGKTTLIKLLCRLYDPTKGRITWDGTDIREFDPQALRRLIGGVFQDFVRYQFSARDNIRFGDADRADNARIEAAARNSGADGVIAGLPKGYDTILGTWFAGAEELSIGQWQKIALARAFVREAPLVVLDEPTSALDAASEYAVFDRFNRLMAGRAAVLVSHRFATVRMADCIYVMDEGRIIEHGSHDQLMRTDGMYARLFALQAGRYR